MDLNTSSSSVSINSVQDNEKCRMSNRPNNAINPKKRNRRILDLKKKFRNQYENGNKLNSAEPLIPSIKEGCSSGNNSESSFKRSLGSENPSIHVEMTEVPRVSEIQSQSLCKEDNTLGRATNPVDYSKEQLIKPSKEDYENVIKPVQALPQEDENWFTKCCTIA